MHGVFIETGVSDWQIIQQTNGQAKLYFSGIYNAPKAAIEVGVESAYPMLRVMSEEDNSQLIPWTHTDYKIGSDVTNGTWSIQVTLPAGGLYRIETGLDTKSTNPIYAWIFRGDCRLHIGVGDVFVVAGQSNSAGYGRDSAYDPTSPYVHLFRNRGTWDLACHPINESTYAADSLNSEMGISGVSPYLAFGKALNKITNYPVGLISTALGGQAIARWDTRKNGDLYHNMMDKIKACGGNPAGILWYQGCSDTTPERRDTYLDSFKYIVSQTRSELGYDIPFFTFQLNRELASKDDESYGIIREAQRQAARTIPNIYIITTHNIPLCDGIHNNAHGNMQIGEKMAKLCAHVLYQKPDFSAPDIDTATGSGSTLTLTFTNMSRGFLICTADPAFLGFKVTDTRGYIPVKNFIAEKQKSVLHLELERELEGKATLSFCSEAIPSFIPPVDEVTFLPPLSFYQLMIEVK